MQTILAILITGCMGLATIFLPIQITRSARSLGFSRRRQVRVGVVTFLILGTWLGLVLWGSLTGFFRTPVFEVYGIPFTHVTYLVLGPVIFGSLLLWLSPTTRALIDTFTPFRVIMIETARAIGAVFLVRYFRGELPGIFALPAGIGDVFIGVTAPIMAYLYRAYGKKVRALVIGWNVLGIAELATSFTIGYLAFALKVFPGVVISEVAVPTAFPLVLIPGFGVPLTILVHIIALRLILRQKS